MNESNKEGKSRGAEDNGWGSFRLDKPCLQTTPRPISNTCTEKGGVAEEAEEKEDEPGIAVERDATLVGDSHDISRKSLS